MATVLFNQEDKISRDIRPLSYPPSGIAAGGFNTPGRVSWLKRSTEWIGRGFFISCGVRTMYQDANTWAWNQKVPTQAKIILVYVASIRDSAAGRCFSSVATIAAKCGMGKSTVNKYLALLESDGYLTRKHRTAHTRRTSSELILNMGVL